MHHTRTAFLLLFLPTVLSRDIIAVTHENLSRELGRALDSIERLLAPKVTTCLLNVTNSNGGLAGCSDWRLRTAQAEAEIFFNVTASVISPTGLAGRDAVLCETINAIGRLGVLLSIVMEPGKLVDDDQLLTDTWLWIMASNWHAMAGSTLRVIFPILYSLGWHLYTRSDYVYPKGVDDIPLWPFEYSDQLHGLLGRSIIRGLRSLSRGRPPSSQPADVSLAYRMLALVYTASCEYGCGDACLASASAASMYLGLAYTLTEGDGETLGIAASLVGRSQLLVQSIFTQSFAEGLWLIHHTSAGFLWRLFYAYVESPVILLDNFRHLKGLVEYQESAFEDIFHNIRRLLPPHECRMPQPQPRDLLWRSRMSAEEVYWRYRLYDEGYTHPLSNGRPLQSGLLRLVNPDVPKGSAIRVLDVGSGPLSLIGMAWDGHPVELVAVDPLAPLYKALLHQVGVDPIVYPVMGDVENLPRYFPTGSSFDLAVSINALDHTIDPVKSIFGMLETVKPHGAALLVCHRNEAEREYGKGLHQWNFDVSPDGHLLVWRNYTSAGPEVRDVTTMLLEKVADSVEAEVLEAWDEELVKEWYGFLGVEDDDDVPHVMVTIRKRSM
ncbi:hypothetical protein FOZ60_008314 [Perkinsus olseni]|uniref:Methyltransferase type 11 domain-containing protein n=1 Tax=Perkinsus olseni TaxID=32597 RepID=A0A7J6NJG7_PEROL|nr:hypothetical protein FOZ60_008314 [Perkinsus olseni]